MEEPKKLPAPDLSKAFKKAHDAEKKEGLQANEGQTVTKKQIEDLENLRKRPTKAMDLTPKGIRPVDHAERERALRIAKMKERLRQDSGRARDDFNRQAGREQ